MCEFISWIELPGKGEKPRIRFLTTDLIPKAVELGIDPLDLAGHEAIRRVYGLLGDEGTERECTDFSTPSNFPPEIVKALLQGRMTGFGSPPLGILSKPLNKEYKAKCKLLDGEYWAKVKPLGEEYWAKCKFLNEEYWAKVKPLDEEYWARRKPLDEEYWAKVLIPANRAEAWREVN